MKTKTLHSPMTMDWCLMGGWGEPQTNSVCECVKAHGRWESALQALTAERLIDTSSDSGQWGKVVKPTNLQQNWQDSSYSEASNWACHNWPLVLIKRRKYAPLSSWSAAWTGSCWTCFLCWYILLPIFKTTSFSRSGSLLAISLCDLNALCWISCAVRTWEVL